MLNFYVCKLRARAFVPGKPFQPSLIFVGKAWAYPSKAPLYGRLLALLTNIRLGWKGLLLENTLAYDENSQFTDVKSFIKLAPRLILGLLLDLWC